MHHVTLPSDARVARSSGAAPVVVPLEELTLAAAPSVGGKAANLGELMRAGLPVPRGFVVPAQAYLRAMEIGRVRQDLIETAALCDASDPTSLDLTADRQRELVQQAGIPFALLREILDAYGRLGDRCSVAVRSSATTEDGAASSFAGMHATFTNVTGEEALAAAISGVWQSVWGRRVIAYRASQELTAEPAIAVIVQIMVDADRAGVVFTADPSSGRADRLVVDAAFGLGEVVVSGQVEPDTYVLARSAGGPRLLELRIGEKSHKIVRGPHGRDRRVALDPSERTRRVLDDDQILRVARLAERIAGLHDSPQDVEWALAGEELFALQARPITALGRAAHTQARGVLVRGLGASSGSASGVVRILASFSEAERLAAGEVMVASTTNPDWVQAMQRAAALVTDGGGMTCHTAIVSRELGVPCVVGTRSATRILREGELVTVDGDSGVVFAAQKARRERSRVIHGRRAGGRAGGRSR